MIYTALAVTFLIACTCLGAGRVVDPRRGHSAAALAAGVVVVQLVLLLGAR